MAETKIIKGIEYTRQVPSTPGAYLNHTGYDDDPLFTVLTNTGKVMWGGQQLNNQYPWFAKLGIEEANQVEDLKCQLAVAKEEIQQLKEDKERNGKCSTAAIEQLNTTRNELKVAQDKVKEVLEDFVRICDTAKPMEFLSQLGELSQAARKALEASNQADVLDWAVRRWNEEVKNRPLVNVHRRTLDNTWRQIVRAGGGDDRKLLGPTHDELVAKHGFAEVSTQPNEHQNAWLDGQKGCGIDPVPLTKEGVIATLKSLQSDQADVLKEERKLTDDLVAALRKLLRRDERNTCQHEETYRGGVLWTICSSCGRKWADDEGGMPKFDEPIEWVESRTALDNVRKHRNEATEGSGS